MKTFSLGNAIAIAAESHKDTKDKGGNAYILHPMRIMFNLNTKDEELMAIAILHDVIEDDTAIDFDYLKSEGMTERVISSLRCLTHFDDESYEDYIKRVATNSDAIKVKLCDLRDNSDITRLKGITEKDFSRIQKYHKAYLYLTQIQKINGEIYG